MNKREYIPWMIAAGFALSFAFFAPAFAQAQTSAPSGWGGGGHYGMRGGMAGGMAPGVFGTVSAVDGTTLTVTSKTRPNATSTTGTVYAVDATNAQVFDNGATSTVASINVGDTVMVQGTVSGTNIAATVIRDGLKGGMSGMPAGKRPGSGRAATSTPPIQGNGEPVIAGSVTAISGTTLTVTNASNVTYTIDASSANIVENGASTTLSSVAAGDNVVIQGTVNGTSVAASSIIDQGSGNKARSESHFGDFFGAIGSFFKHLFGF